MEGTNTNLLEHQKSGVVTSSGEFSYEGILVMSVMVPAY